MKKRWWILGAIVAVGAGPAIFSDDTADTESGETRSAVEESLEAESPETAEAPADEPTGETEPREAESSTEELDSPAVVTQDDTEGLLAIDVLATLEVKGRAPNTGYDRDQFGQRWADVDRNGCDTRNDILSRDLTEETFKPGTHDCVVLTGTLVSPYTGETIAFQRGESTSSEVQIDHVVALSDAWQKGAQQMSPDTRELFANDPLNLLAVDGRSNSQKGAGDAATWLPSNKSYRCEYVARQVGVKAKYGLWVTAAEKDAIERILSSCPDQKIPASDELIPVAASEPAPTPEPVEPAPAPPTAPAPADVYYANCTEARAAGVTPLYENDPGYRSGMDGDGDGIACE